MSEEAAATVTRDPYRWAMLGSMALLYLCFGVTTVSMAPLVHLITADLGLSHSAMGGVMGAWPLAYIVFAIPCGALLDRIGPRRGVALAAIIMALSLGLRGVATDHLTLFLAVAVFGIGGPLISIGAPKVISMWFEGSDRGLAMGIYFTGNALGGIGVLSLTNSIAMPLAGNEWRMVMFGYAGIVLLSGVCWVLVSGHASSRALESRLASQTRRSQAAVFGELLAHPVIRLLLLMSVGTFFFNHTLNNWLPEILRGGGMDAVSAGYWASVPTAVGIAASLTIPRLASPDRRFAILASLFVLAGTATLLLQSQGNPGLALGLILQGVTRGAMGAVVILILMETKGVGAQAMGAAGGLYFSFGEVGGVLGPLTFGYLSDLTGGFDTPLYVLTGDCAFLLLMLAAIWRISRRG